MESSKKPIYIKVITLLRNITLAIVAMLLLLCLSGVVLFKFVLTPERMTPVIEEAAQRYINSEISIASVDFSLFSTLPQVSLRIDSLRIKQLTQGVDDLFSVDQCVVMMTPKSLLKKRVVINEIKFKRPQINLYVDSVARPMAHFRIDSTMISQNDTATIINFGEYRFRFDSIQIDSARVTIDDRLKWFYSSMDDVSLGVKLITGQKRTMLKSVFGFSNFNVRLADKVFSSNNSMSIASKLVYKRDSALLRISDTYFNLNSIAMRAEGVITKSLEERGVDVDIYSSLSTPSLTEFLNLVPSHILIQKDSILTDGTVDLRLHIDGLYSESSMPDFTAQLNVDNASMRYAENPISLDRVNCDARMLIDLNSPQNSYAKINNFEMSTSGIIDMKISGDVKSILQSPYCDLNFDSNVDFDRISEIVPLQAGVTLSGRNTNDLRAQFLLEDLQRGNYGDLFISGESKFDNVKIDIDGAQFLADSTATTYFNVDIESGTLLFGDKVRENNSRTLLVSANCSNFGFKDRDGLQSASEGVVMTMGANIDRETKRVNGVGANVILQNTKLGKEGEMSVELGVTDLTLTISPKNEERNTKMFAKISTQSIFATEPQFNSTVSAKRARFELDMLRRAPRKWHMDGSMGFRNFNIYSDLFPIDMQLDRSAMTISGNKITLKKTKIDMGESSIVATGYITNIISALFVDPKIDVEGKLKIKSPLLNVNELMSATNRSVLMNQADSTTRDVAERVSDSTGMMLLVPRGVKFEFDMDVDKIKFNETYLEQIKGLASVNEGVVLLDRLSFSTIGADTYSSVKYYNIDDNASNISMNIDMQGVEIDRIDELLPTVTQFMPMINSLDGVANFQLKANTNIDRDLNIDFETLRAASRLSGSELVLMDEETFDEVAQTLMFKNKERNVIDTLGINILADKSKFTVLPFELTIDRYQMVIGGEQSITSKSYDIEYDYNISIIKSPLPFKAGVDIVGRNADFKHKVTKAKLKKSDFTALNREYEAFRETIEQ